MAVLNRYQEGKLRELLSLYYDLRDLPINFASFTQPKPTIGAPRRLFIGVRRMHASREPTRVMLRTFYAVAIFDESMRFRPPSKAVYRMIDGRVERMFGSDDISPIVAIAKQLVRQLDPQLTSGEAVSLAQLEADAAKRDAKTRRIRVDEEA